VPGERTVAFAPTPEAERLVAAMAELTAARPAPFVLVGGLAVAARLEVFHRATQDLDAVVAQERARFHDLTVEAVTSARVRGGHLVVADVPVDVIDVDVTTAYDDIARLDDPRDRLFTAGHLFAYRDASALELVCADARAVVRIATPRALLVSKLHAYLSPRRGPGKAPSDALDVLELGRLLVRHDRTDFDDDVPDVVRRSARWGVAEVAANPSELVRRLGLAGTKVPAAEVEALLSLLDDDLSG
jgi:predicted nucleotidyltransferase